MNKVKILLLPHFEVGEINGDFPGEAQLFYEEYLSDSEIYEIRGGYRLYYCSENQIALCVTGSGKCNTATCVTSVLCDSRFDFGEAYIVAPGCAGGAAGYSVPGDVCIISGVCDNDLGHTPNALEADPDSPPWYNEPSYNDISSFVLDEKLVSMCYDLTKDMALCGTEGTRKVMKRNFPGEDWADREPMVIKGSAVTGDNYWKGRHDHDRADYICRYYGLPDRYAMSEMEDVAIAAVADKFGMLNRLISVRCNVNPDVFLDGATPESLWSKNESFNTKVEKENEETLDIFSPAIRNLAAVVITICDELLK